MNGDDGIMMPLGNLSMNNLSLMNAVSLAPPSPSHQGGQQPGSNMNLRSESDQTLHGDMSSTTRHGNNNYSDIGGMDESMGFSQVSSNYFNSMLNSHQLYPPQQHHQYQQYQEHSQTSPVSLRGQGRASELIEEQSVVDLGTLSRIVIGESGEALEMRRSGRDQQQQEQHERQYI